MNSNLQRPRTHAVLTLLTLLSVYGGHVYAPTASLSYKITVGTGYLALTLLALTLVMSPVYLLRDSRKRNPVNVMLRRDIGIWAGFTGLAHVITGFTVHFGPAILPYFVRYTENGYRLLGNPFGWANHTGLAATLILSALLLTSNNRALKWLRGPRWKALQRWNYALVVLVFVHTVLYQMVSRRQAPFGWYVFGLGLVVVVAQFAGMQLVRERRRLPQRSRHS